MTRSIELWAGVECTVNRVGDQFFDQLESTGHAARESDIDRIAWLCPGAVRYPILWERTAPSDPADAAWGWSDARLARLRAHGIRPIVGLVHHGSGPSHTSLLDPDFPEKLASYAAAVAARYPWIQDWTPVNEPLTTARFSALYGLWYPHARDPRDFVAALLNECRGTALAMRAIRQVIPGARLIQTEDLGLISSTPRLAYQAAFENERRWLSIDLLTGRVAPHHPLWRYLLDAGAPQVDLDELRERPCPPDVLGINYYVTSDRFLDERFDRYPAHTRGGNGRHVYADVEAVRVRGCAIAGHCAQLTAAWSRYRLPVALTEVHLACTEDEQVRWLVAAWEGAEAARREGVDVRAATVWSVFGAVDWDCLVTRRRGRYEPGAFDVRGAEPRPTPLAFAARELGTLGRVRAPVSTHAAWWNSPHRVLYPSPLAAPGLRHPDERVPLTDRTV